MNERRRILDDGSGGNVVTLRVTTTDGSTNVGIEMVVTNGNNVYQVTTDSQGKVEMTGLSGGCTIDCETHEISVYEFIATGTMTVDISAYVNSFPVGETRSFNYTGAVSEVQLIPGSYKLQVWGAQGGSNAADSSYGITAKAGGKGGYSEGIITLSTKTTVRVYVGGQGSSSAGGFNGGGSTTGSASYTTGTSGQAGYVYGTSRMGGGGGATDIRLSDGALLSRMIVAGGGSGGAMTYRKETTSTTSWQTVASGTANIFIQKLSSGVCEYAAVVPAFENGVTYKLTTSGTSTTYGISWWNGAPSGSGHWVGGKYGISNGASFSYNDIPTTGGYTFCVNCYNANESDSTPTFTLQKLVTTTSTNSYTDSQVGFAGGGTTGVGYSSTYRGKQNAAGSGGSFGQGANQTITNYRHCSGAGGGGWYGGGGGSYSDSSTYSCKYSGGGSGWVNIAANASYRPSGYIGLELDSGETKAGNTSFPNTSGTGTEYGHSGNGYAKITRIS